MAEQQLEGFIDKFAPEMRGFIRDCRAKVQRLPSAVQLVYDYYNFFLIGFSPTRRPSDAILSLAAHRRGVNLCFLQRGPDVPDRAGSCAAVARYCATSRLRHPRTLIAMTFTR